MTQKLRLPSPAMAVALAALFVALGGTAVAAGVPALAKRALVADNAKKVGGQTPAALLATAKQAADASASAAAQQPGPASTAAGLIAVKTAPFALGSNQDSEFSVTCDAGQKAIAGGYDNPVGIALGFDTRPSSDGTGWRVYLSAGSSGGAGNVYAVCLK